MLSDLAVVVVLDAKVVNDLKEEGKGKQLKVKTVVSFRDSILNTSVNTKEVEWLYQYIGKEQKNQVI